MNHTRTPAPEHSIPKSARTMKPTVALAAALTLASTIGLAGPAAAVSAPDTPAGTSPYLVKVDSGYGTCTGSLVDRQWVATSASCFSANPAEFGSLKAGPPARPSKVLVGTDAADRTKAGIGITHIEPAPEQASRDFALVRLARPIDGIAPLKIAATAPQTAEALSFAGFGRTATEWIPQQPHTGSFSVDSVDGAAITVSASTPGAALCAGDSGAPGVRSTANGPELVAVNSRSWQNGCLYVETSNSGASASRVDDLTDWIRSILLFNVGDGSVAEIKATGNNGNCLSVKEPYAETAPCGTSQTKQWQFSSAGANTYTIKNVSSGKCLGGSASTPTPTQISFGTCDPNDATVKWELTRQTDGTTVLKNAGKLTLAGFRSSMAAAYTDYVAATATNTKWLLGSAAANTIGAADLLTVTPILDLNHYRSPGTTIVLAAQKIGTWPAGLKAGFVADWNGDGFRDVISHYTDGKLNVALGWAGGFQSPFSLGTTYKDWTLLVGRWKRTDPLPGVVGYNAQGEMFYLANPAGSILSTGVKIGNGWSMRITMTDFDKDGNADILGSYSTGELKLFRSTGTGTFIAETRPLIGAGWDTITSMTPVLGFAGPNTSGIIARVNTGVLRYYPIGANRTWGTPIQIGNSWNGLTIMGAQ